MAIKVSGTTVVDDNRKGSFMRVNPGTYTNSNRPNSPNVGDIIYNSDEQELQVWDGSEWNSTGSGGGGALTVVTLAPLSGTPNYTITAVTDISAIPDGATATYNWYRYDEAIGTAGKTLLTSTVSSEISDTYTAGSLEQGKYVGCTVIYLGDIVSETERSAASAASVPIAYMNGLRFEKSRSTNLIRRTAIPYLLNDGGGGSPNPDISFDYTISYWVKYTDVTTYSITCLSESDTDTNGPWFGISPSWNIYTPSGGHNSASSGPEANKWYHVCVNVEGGAARMYVDGALVLGPINYCGTRNTGFRFGYTGLQADMDAYGFCGYISDAYYVDGRVLPPTAFGKQYLLGWGPLDNTVVKQNIGEPPESPYDLRPNWDRVWSTGLVGADGDSPAINAFDGKFTTNARNSGDNSQLTLTFSPALVASTISFSSNMSAAASYYGKIEVTYSDGTTVEYPSPFGGSSTFGAPLATNGKSISVVVVSSNTGGTSLNAIQVDGRTLVDGPVNVSQDWTSTVTPDYNGGTDAEGNPYYPVSNAFLGTLSQGYPGTGKEYFTGGTASAGATITFNQPITNVSSVRIYAYASQGGGWSGSPVWLNGKTIGANNPSPRDESVWFEFPSLGSITLTDIQTANYNSYISAIEVNGERLTDTSLYQSWDTSQVWTKMLSGGPGRDNEDVFDGNASLRNTVAASNGDSDLVWTLSPVPVGAKVRIKAVTGSNAGPITCNGVAIPANTPNSVVDCGDTTSSTLTITQAVTPGGTVSDDSGIFYVEVDGKILVDANSFGTYGFYLPFNPEAEGEIYSNNRSSNNYFAGNPPSKAFDGIPEDVYCVASGQMIFSFDDLPFNKIRIAAGNGSGNLKVNGVNVSSYISSGVTYALEDITQYVTSPLQTVELNNSDGLAAIELDDNILLDHISIGVDDSGNNNDFMSENFAVGNTSQIWSANAVEIEQNAGYPAEWKMFDGNLATGAFANNSTTGVVQWDAITAEKSIRLLGNSSSATAWKVIINGADVSVPWLDPNNPNWTNILDLTYPCSFSGIKNDEYLGIVHAIEVDGKILVDKNKRDTVFDTPMNNYSVLDESGNMIESDGNLRAEQSGGGGNSAANQTLELDKRYYAEATFIGEYNAGFALSNGMILSNNPAGGAPAKYYGLFQYSDGDYYQYQNGNREATGINATPGDVLGLLVDTPNKQLRYFLNGFQVIQLGFTDANDSEGYDYVVSTGNQPSNFMYANFGQQPFSNSNVTDNGNGTVTVTTPSQEPSATRPNFTQKWSDTMTTIGGWATNQGPEKAFNGVIGSSLNMANATGDITWAFDTYGLTGSMRVNIQNNGGIVTDGNGVERGRNTGTTGWVQLEGDISDYGGSITISVLADVPSCAGIEVNGRLLTDGPSDTSRNWADGASGEIGSALLAFDGDLTGGNYAACNAANGTGTITFNPGLSVNTQLRLYARNDSRGPTEIAVNGQTTPISTGSEQWHDVTAYANGNLTSISLSRPNSAVGTPALFAVEIDGTILIDENNWPEWNQDQIWSSGTDPSVWGDLVPVGQLFDGNLSTYSYAKDLGGYQLVSWSAITANSSIRVYGRGTENSWQVIVDGNPVSVEFSGNQPSYDSWRTLNTTFPCQVTGIQSSSPGAVYAIEVDGKILVDQGIGGDMICQKLYKTWTEQQAEFFNAELVRLGNYEAALRAVAAAYIANGSYDEGAIVSHNGELWQAVVNGAEAVTPAVSASVTWKQLGLSS